MHIPQVKITRIGELLRHFCKQTRTARREKKVVRFLGGGAADLSSGEAPREGGGAANLSSGEALRKGGGAADLVSGEAPWKGGGGPALGHAAAEGGTAREEPEIPTDQLGDFIGPVVCTICASCATVVCTSSSLAHSELLSSLLRLYGRDTLVRSLLSHMERTRDSVSVWQSCAEQPSMSMALCSALFKIVDFEGLCSSAESVRLAESVVETVVMVMYGGGATEQSAALFLSEIAKVWLLHGMSG